MPELNDVINNYTNGATGTFNDDLGQPVDYSISGNATNSQGGVWEHDSDSARVYSWTGYGSYFDVNFSAPINGLLIEMRGSDTSELYGVRVDGVVIDLNQWIADGRAIFTTTRPGSPTGNHFVDANGALSSTGIYNDGSVGYVQFTVPIKQLGIQGVNPGGTGGFDDFEIGVVPTAVIACFCSGSLIGTPNGMVPVETLQAGDLVLTLDHGAQPIRWIGDSRLDRVDLTLAPKRKPIRIRAGALGTGLPERDLLVSRQHRIFLQSEIAADLFGASEILVPAVKLLGLDGVAVVEDAQEVSYWHILFDQHELIFSAGVVSESLYTGKEARKAIPAAALAELIDLGFWDAEADEPAAMARTEIRKTQSVNKLLRLHAKRNLPLLG